MLTLTFKTMKGLLRWIALTPLLVLEANDLRKPCGEYIIDSNSDKLLEEVVLLEKVVVTRSVTETDNSEAASRTLARQSGSLAANTMLWACRCTKGPLVYSAGRRIFLDAMAAPLLPLLLRRSINAKPRFMKDRIGPEIGSSS